MIYVTNPPFLRSSFFVYPPQAAVADPFQSLASEALVFLGLYPTMKITVEITPDHGFFFCTMEGTVHNFRSPYSTVRINPTTARRHSRF